jgi:hypothetical protein
VPATSGRSHYRQLKTPATGQRPARGRENAAPATEPRSTAQAHSSAASGHAPLQPQQHALRPDKPAHLTEAARAHATQRQPHQPPQRNNNSSSRTKDSGGSADNRGGEAVWSRPAPIASVNSKDCQSAMGARPSRRSARRKPNRAHLPRQRQVSRNAAQETVAIVPVVARARAPDAAINSACEYMVA